MTSINAVNQRIAYKVKKHITVDISKECPDGNDYIWPKAVKHTTMDAVMTKIKSCPKLKAATDIIRNKEIDSNIRRATKARLPAFYPFDVTNEADGVALITGNVNATGTMVFDYDLSKEEPLTNTPEGAQALRKKLLSSGLKDTLLFCFTSPSGGLKFAIRTNITEPLRYKHAYEQVLNDMAKIDIILDRATTDIGRATYISYDPEVYYNPNCGIADFVSLYGADFEKQQASVQEIQRKKRESFNLNAGEHNKDYAYKHMLEELSDLFSKIGTDRNFGMWNTACIVFSHGFDVDMLEKVYHLAYQNGVMDKDIKPSSFRYQAERKFNDWDGTPSLQFYKPKAIKEDELFF